MLLQSVEQFSAVSLQCVKNETVFPVENDTNKECDDSIKVPMFIIFIHFFYKYD